MSEKKKPKFKKVKNNPNIQVRDNLNGTRSWGVKAYDPSLKRTVWIGTFETLKEAKQSKRKFEEREHSGRRESRLTVREYSSTWLSRHKDLRKASTRKTYAQGVLRFVEVFGDTQIKDLRRMECVDWASTQGDWVVNPSRIMLADMMRDDLLVRNPLANLRRATSPGRKNFPALGTSEVEDLIDACFEELRPEMAGQVAGIIASCAYLGLRKSEAFALRKIVVDIESETILVDAQVGPNRAFLPPKTGIRDIALTEQSRRAWERFGPSWEARTMFGHTASKCFTAGSFDFQFSKVRSAVGIRGLTMHELRHFHSTWLDSIGVPISAIAVQMGHALPGPAMTNHYIHGEKRELEFVREKTRGNTDPLATQGRANFVPPRLGGGGRR